MKQVRIILYPFVVFSVFLKEQCCENWFRPIHKCACFAILTALYQQCTASVFVCQKGGGYRVLASVVRGYYHKLSAKNNIAFLLVYNMLHHCVGQSTP